MKINEVKNIINEVIVESIAVPHDFDENEFYRWIGTKYQITSNFLKSVKYQLDGVGDITNDIKELLYQLDLPMFKNNGLTQQQLNKLLYNNIRQIEKENEKYPELIVYNKNNLEKLKFYKSEIKNIDIIIPYNVDTGLNGDDFFGKYAYKVEFNNGKLKVELIKIK
jgi:hypothetical protein